MDALDFILRLASSFLPVVIFLLTLTFLDSYKLLSLRRIVATIGVGCVVAAACLPVNDALIDTLGVDSHVFSRYGAPVVEETLKAAFIVFLIVRGRVGFMVDAAIAGFAVGTGFALVENTYYLNTLQDKTILVWLIRGFGTAVMHGGMTAVFGIVSKTLFDRGGRARVLAFIPGLLLVVALHSGYNHFILSPVLSTVVIHVALPVIILAVFYQSERATKHWLGSKMDVETELLAAINEGKMSDTHVGEFLEAIRTQFPPETVFDMMCYLRLHTELAISAKGVLMMREAGFSPKPPDDIEPKFRELRHLQKSIGKTGRIALMPILHESSRDLWQLHMLGK